LCSSRPAPCPQPLPFHNSFYFPCSGQSKIWCVSILPSLIRSLIVLANKEHLVTKDATRLGAGQVDATFVDPETTWTYKRDRFFRYSSPAHNAPWIYAENVASPLKNKQTVSFSSRCFILGSLVTVDAATMKVVQKQKEVAKKAANKEAKAQRKQQENIPDAAEPLPVATDTAVRRTIYSLTPTNNMKFQP
jgi:hypothetical protein